MAKVYTYLVVITGLMLLFHLAGFTTTAGYVLQHLYPDNPEGIGLTAFFVSIAAVFAGATIGGLVIGYFTKSSSESFMLAAYSSILLLFVSDMVFIMVYLNSNYGGWAAALGTLVVFPTVIGYLHAVVSWWGGKE